MKNRIALLGVAHVHAHAYAVVLRSRPDVELLSFSEDDPERAAEFARSTGLSWQPLAILLAARPDGVIVCTENARRRRPVQARATGKHVLCEKLIATAEQDALGMWRAYEEAGVQFVTAFPARFSAMVQTLTGQLRGGEQGAVLAYSGVNHSVVPDREQR